MLLGLTSVWNVTFLVRRGAACRRCWRCWHARRPWLVLARARCRAASLTLRAHALRLQGCPARAILPYCQALSKLAPHIQQASFVVYFFV